MLPTGDAGWFSPTLLLLPAQAIAAIVAIRAFRTRIAPNIAGMQQPAAAIDCLGPFAIALPLVVAGWRVNWDVSGAGWLSVGAPGALTLLAAGLALCAAGAVERTSSLRIAPLHAAAWSACGALLLLIGAAHDLTIWTGQCAFAAGAILLWLNSPELVREPPRQPDLQASGGMMIVLLAALVQAASVALTPRPYLMIAGGIVLAQTAAMLLFAALRAGPIATWRLAGWSATYATLLGLGVISLRHLLPQTLEIAGGARGRPPLRVAYGFGEYAIEATILLLFGVASLVIDRIAVTRGSSPLRRLIGVLIALAAAALMVWRMRAV